MRVPKIMKNMKISDLTFESIFGAGVASASIVGRRESPRDSELTRRAYFHDARRVIRGRRAASCS